GRTVEPGSLPIDAVPLRKLLRALGRKPDQFRIGLADTFLRYSQVDFMRKLRPGETDDAVQLCIAFGTVHEAGRGHDTRQLRRQPRRINGLSEPAQIT